MKDSISELADAYSAALRPADAQKEIDASDMLRRRGAVIRPYTKLQLPHNKTATKATSLVSDGSHQYPDVFRLGVFTLATAMISEHRTKADDLEVRIRGQ